MNGRSVQIMEESRDEATTLLRAAMGAPPNAALGRGDLTQARAGEDATIAAWSAAVADYEQAVGAREQALGRAEADIHRRMAPLSPARYLRMEQTLARALPDHRSAAWVRDMICVQRTRAAVREARRRLATLIDETDAELSAAGERRASATAELTRVLGVGRASRVTGLSSRRLNRMRAGL